MRLDAKVRMSRPMHMKQDRKNRSRTSDQTSQPLAYHIIAFGSRFVSLYITIAHLSVTTFGSADTAVSKYIGHGQGEAASHCLTVCKDGVLTVRASASLYSIIRVQ